MGSAFPKEERLALVTSDPVRFQLPMDADLRFNWVHASLGALDAAEARELVVDAWRMVVPRKVWRAYDRAFQQGPNGAWCRLTPRRPGRPRPARAEWPVGSR